MSKWEELKAWVKRWGHPNNTSMCPLDIQRKMAELEAAEVKERPDSEGWWWSQGCTEPVFFTALDVDCWATDVRHRYIKIDKPTFPEPEKLTEQVKKMAERRRMMAYRTLTHRQVCIHCRWRNYDSAQDENWCMHDPAPSGLPYRGVVSETGTCEYWEDDDFGSQPQPEEEMKNESL